MKTDLSHIERHKVAGDGGDDGGAWVIGKLRVIASWGKGWDHVSVSRKDRCPDWAEMDFVKRLFWEDEEAVMQLHPPRSTWVNNHASCLHLWRPHWRPVPLPPVWMVGVLGVEP